MADDRPASIFFFAPFVSSTMVIEPGWIDYNGHLNMAYYHVLFDRAVDEAFGVVGLGPDYLESGRGTTFAAEVHVRYRRELVLDDPIRVTLQLIAFDENGCTSIPRSATRPRAGSPPRRKTSPSTSIRRRGASRRFRRTSRPTSRSCSARMPGCRGPTISAG